MKNKQYLFLFSLLAVSQILFSQQSVPKNITAEDYISLYKDIAIKKMLEYKIPASITLAQGLLESANGNSKLAVEANNHFGIKCHKEWNGEKFYQDDDEKNECFRKYVTAEESFNDHSLFLTTRSRYQNLFKLEINDYKAWAQGLKDAGYATNPNYAQLLITRIEKFELYKFDLMNGINVITTPEETKITKEIRKESYGKEPDEFFIGASHRKLLLNNRVKYIKAKKGDNIKDLTSDLDMFEWQIIKYNDLTKTDTINEGAIIYIQPKRRKGEKDFHLVEKGETIRSISQKYAVKIKCICKKNELQSSSELIEGQKILLR